MTQEEITAEVFKVIRASEYVDAKSLHVLIKEHLPDVSNKELEIAYQYIYNVSE